MKETYALVTGASKGIGKAVAAELAGLGYALDLISLPGEQLAQVSDSLKDQYKVDVKWLEVDLIHAGAAQEVKRWCISEGINVSVLINNAGVGYEGRFENFDTDFYERLLKINVVAPTLLIRELLPLLKINKQSYILNSSSFASFYVMPFKSVYASSKSYLTHFSKALRKELRHYNVSVSYLCPAGVDTYEESSKRIEQIGWVAKIGRSTAEEVAKCAVQKMLQGRSKIIPGKINLLYHYFSMLIPSSVKTNAIHRELSRFYPALVADIRPNDKKLIYDE